MILLAPSILSADFAALGAEVAVAEASGGDWIHVDVMDGHFVPNITLGPPIVKAVKAHTSLPLDVHLMIEHPERYIADFAAAGASVITVHAEACVHLHRVIHQIKELGLMAGVAINPATPASAVREVLEDVDMVLVMTVNPGFGGQAFIPNTLRKIRQIREWAAEINHPNLRIEVDGGIAEATAGLVAEAGADVLVAGNAVFGRPDRAAAIQAIREAAEAALR
ncbi:MULTISPECIES: ribulose-phosphate 3-epimerase [unclassified Paenibacillus]|uniref:ribulose-phosphate 3-epimerase n=1 Tax=unclassified Paenibacillus TaxID=185978 RepID=UPI0024070401|nr:MULTISPECIES: ribulose-phosphate 3-epimerase [unclassified Paenibacillus]MDF9842912.1 ribulose-phosphate 3-epimerase [Paenibacillus sp. PastF-2]MDF9849500.1 ribulose-phosphate 3-epimerase [Paenibacillus sp. PastM-2]MDF9856125.1 ribulose-phosphate 3-epimerase [Paenibacillus sp. PastF-1]MDH6481343.1 ribulose-phosphate 3-epimerase [Paenibacillus sp. PastH-2]MDH6508814.1 ribulose-phosphate 3-epimerase [Paenibacillus sp. PastM-3]